jgi:hypothetical protein
MQGQFPLRPERWLEAVWRLCNTDSTQTRAADAGTLSCQAQKGQGPHQSPVPPLPLRQCPDGEIGRRSGLKIRRPQGRGGSSPPLGTNKTNNLIITAISPAPIWWERWWETEFHPFDRPLHFAIAGSCASKCPW